MFVCFEKTFSKYTDVNVTKFKEELFEVVSHSVLTSVINGQSIGRKYYRYSRDPLTKEELVKSIEEHVHGEVNRALNGTIFGAKDQYSYAELLKKIITRRKTLEQQVFEEAFNKGMQIGMKFEMLGWHPSKPTFPDCDAGDRGIWWEKEVNIRPDTFMHGGERYLIPAAHRKFYVKKLYVNQNGLMRCEGEHPNVSGSRVCMGDLQIKFSDNLSELQDVLGRVESLLDMINFDSAYNGTALDELLKVSTKDTVFANTAPIRKLKPKIREIGDIDQDDEEEEEEIIESPSDNIVLTDEHGKALIKEFKPVLTQNVQSDIQARETSSDIQEHGLMEIQSAPVYEVNEEEIGSQLSFVDETGNRQNVIEPRQEQNENIALGDNNLIQGGH